MVTSNQPRAADTQRSNDGVQSVERALAIHEHFDELHDIHASELRPNQALPRAADAHHDVAVHRALSYTTE